MTHDAGGLLTAVRDPRGEVKNYTFDSLGRLEEATDPSGGSKTLTRTASGTNLEVELTTGLGRTTTYLVEELSTGERQRTVTSPAGHATVSVEHQDGTRTIVAPDGTQITASTSPDPLFELLAPLAGGEVELPSGLTMTTSRARAVKLTTPGDPSTLETWTDSLIINGRALVSDYDLSTGTVTSTSPEGRVTTAVVDSVGRVLTEVVPGIDSVFFGCDSIGRLETVTQAGDNWSYDYDASGRLRSLTDPLSRTDSLLYDSSDLLVRQVLADSLEITYDYDESGNLTSLTPPGQSAHTFVHNALGLDSIYDPPDVAGLSEDRTIYTYNLDQQLDEIVRPDALTIDLAYDSAGRIDAVTIDRGTLDVAYSATTGQITSITAPGSETVSFAYDGFLPTSETWSGTVSGSVAFAYDTDFRIDGLAVNGDTVAYAYDDDGLLTQAGDLVLVPDSLNGRLVETTLDSVTTRHGYDMAGDLAADSAWVGSTLVFARTYARDELGRITEVIDYADGATTVWGYGYDVFGRLETVTQDSTAYASYEYDSNGNRLSRTSSSGVESGTYDAQDRMSSYDGADFSYTAAGELLEKVVGTDTTRYGYEELGNLTDVELPDGTLIEYVIDGRNRRIGKKVDGDVVQGFLYGDQLNPVAELDSLGNVVSRFVYGSRPNVPDYIVRGADTLRVITDHLGSVRLVVDATTGSVAQKVSYDAWGRVLADSNPGLQPFGFAGGIWVRDVDLVRFGACDYSPLAGRWTTKDPIRFGGGDGNLYAYAGNAPVDRTDPTGTIAPWVITGSLGGVFGVIDAYRTYGWDPGQLSGGFLLGFVGGVIPGFGLGKLSSLVHPFINNILKGATAGALSNYISQKARSSQQCATVDVGQLLRAAALGALAVPLGSAISQHFSQPALQQPIAAIDAIELVATSGLGGILDLDIFVPGAR